MSISATHDDSPGFERNFIRRAIAFYNDELYWLDAKDQLVKIDVPNSANKSIFREHLAIELRDPWTIANRTYVAGSLLIIPFDRFIAGDRQFEVLFEPTNTTALASFVFTRNHIILNVLEDVKDRLFVLTRGDQSWRREPLVGARLSGLSTSWRSIRRVR